MREVHMFLLPIHTVGEHHPYVLFVVTTQPVNITVSGHVKVAKDFSNVPSRRERNTSVWAAKIVLWINDAGTDVSFVGSRSVSQSGW